MVPLVTVFTPDLSELGLASSTCTVWRCWSSYAERDLVYVLLSLVCSTQLCLGTANNAQMVSLWWITRWVVAFRSLFAIELIFSGGPISGALLSSQYRWWIASLFSGVSSFALLLHHAENFIYRYKLIGFVGSSMFVVMRLMIYRRRKTEETLATHNALKWGELRVL